MDRAERRVADLGRVGDRYLLVRRVAARASLETWEALDERLDRSVILRLLTPGARGDAEAMRRLRDERRPAAAMPDPLAPRLLDGGEDVTYGPYVVIEANAAMETTQRIPVLTTTGKPGDAAPRRTSVIDEPGHPARATGSLVNKPAQRRYGLAALVGLVVLVGLASVFVVRTVTSSPESMATGVTEGAEPTRPLSGAAADASRAESTPIPTLSARAQPAAAAPADPTRPSSAPTLRPTAQATPVPPVRGEVAQDSSPVATIQQHYAFIDARRYADGYSLMDAHLRSLNTPAEYASWFANKVSIKPIAVDLVSQTGDQAVVRAVVTTTDRVNGQDQATQVEEQFNLRMEGGAWRIDEVTRQ